MEVATTEQNGIAKWVRDRRTRAGWTQEQLAKELGCRQPDVSDMENGHHTPTIDTMKKLAKVFGVSLSTVVSKLEEA
jgi:transcriptional regulator with XRE-family HTH domain